MEKSFLIWCLENIRYVEGQFIDKNNEIYFDLSQLKNKYKQSV